MVPARPWESSRHSAKAKAPDSLGDSSRALRRLCQGHSLWVTAGWFRWLYALPIAPLVLVSGKHATRPPASPRKGENRPATASAGHPCRCRWPPCDPGPDDPAAAVHCAGQDRAIPPSGARRRVLARPAGRSPGPDHTQGRGTCIVRLRSSVANSPQPLGPGIFCGYKIVIH